MIFSQRISFFASLGTGLFVGIGGIVLYMRLTNRILHELQRLSGVIAELQLEVAGLKEKVDFVGRRKSRIPGFVSASSGDDEDVYEEAYGGSDLESVKELEEEKPTPPADPTSDTSGEEEPFFEKVDRLFDGTDDDTIKAFEILQNNKTKYLTDAEFFWRLSKCSYLMSQIEGARGNQNKKKELIYAAKDLAHTAIGLDEECANAHKWYAITVGSTGDYETTQEKIQNGYIYKKHIEKAIELRPSDPSNHYLLGRWCFGVYMLSWLERKAAAALYSTPPTSTAEEALACFLEADRLNPGKWKENILYIGKCYIELRKYPEAVQWLKKARDLPVINQDDRLSQTEIDKLLTKYRS